MSTTTTAPARYYAARADGRYRVIDGRLIDARQDGDAPGAAYVSTHSSRAKAEAKAAALNAAEPWGTPEVPPMRECADDTCCGETGPADARQERADELAEAVAAGEVDFDTAVAELLGGAAASPAVVREVPRTEVEDRVEASMARAAAKKADEATAPAEEETKAYRIGKVLDEWITAHAADYPADLVGYIAGRNLCYDGTRTLRVTPAWVEALSAVATDVENAALGEGMDAALRAPAVRASRAARATLGKLFA